LLVVALLATERRLVRRLRHAAATSPDTAAPLTVHSFLARFRLARLQRAGAVVAAGSGRFFLDAAGYARYRQSRRRRAIVVLTAALPILLFLWWRS
jgi:Mn-dependent DtxR family transcriptional regulator